MTSLRFWEVVRFTPHSHHFLRPKLPRDSSKIAWICGQCTFKNEGSEPGPCHFCQAPHRKRKAVVVPVPTPSPALRDAAALAVASVLLAKPAYIQQPARSSSSVIDLSSPDAALAVASMLPAKPVCIRQPAGSSSSVIDLSAPDVALAVASVSPTKPVFIRQPARSSGSVIDLSASDVALAVASVSLMKPAFGLSSGIVIDILAGIDTGDLGCQCR